MISILSVISSDKSVKKIDRVESISSNSTRADKLNKKSETTKDSANDTAQVPSYIIGNKIYNSNGILVKDVLKSTTESQDKTSAITSARTPDVKKDHKPEGTNKDSDTKSKTITGTKNLTSEQKKAAEDLKKIDREVRNHEQAHVAAGGGLVRGGASFQYVSGPDGAQYAVGGEVQIDMSSVKGNPAATIQKMAQVKSAALAPADPSGQDRSVAASASLIESEAIAELTKTNTENVTNNIKPLESKFGDNNKTVSNSKDKNGNKNSVASQIIDNSKVVQSTYSATETQNLNITKVINKRV